MSDRNPFDPQVGAERAAELGSLKAQVLARRTMALKQAEAEIEQARSDYCPVYFAANRAEMILRRADMIARASVQRGESFDAFKANLSKVKANRVRTDIARAA